MSVVVLRLGRTSIRALREGDGAFPIALGDVLAMTQPETGVVEAEPGERAKISKWADNPLITPDTCIITADNPDITLDKWGYMRAEVVVRAGKGRRGSVCIRVVVCRRPRRCCPRP